MCLDPMSSGIMQGFSSYTKAKNAQAVDRYNASVAGNNAQVAAWQAEDAKARGDVAAAGVRRRTSGRTGSQIASLAARGLDVGYGSPNALVTDTDFFGAYDENVARANTGKEVWGHRVKQAGYETEATNWRAAARAENPILSGILGGLKGFTGGGGDIDGFLTSARAVSDRWYGSSSTYDYRGSTLPDSLRGGG